MKIFYTYPEFFRWTIETNHQNPGFLKRVLGRYESTVFSREYLNQLLEPHGVQVSAFFNHPIRFDAGGIAFRISQEQRQEKTKMGCIIKLKENTFIEWSLPSDSPASFVMDLQGVIAHFKSINEVREIESLLPLNIEEIIERLERTGTTDSSGSLTLEEILSYNRAGVNEAQINSVEELIARFRIR